MSYYSLPNKGMWPGYYQQLPAWTVGAQQAPVPGWGKNPHRAGPPRVGVGAAYAVPWNDAVLPRYVPVGATAGEATYGHVAGAGAGGIILGLGFAWLWFGRKKR